MAKITYPDQRIIDVGFTDVVTPISVTSDSGLIWKDYCEEVVDDGSITLPVSTSGGWGFAQAGDGEEYVLFSYTSAAAVNVLAASTNGVNTDTDDKFCVFDSGTQVKIRNRLAATKRIIAKIYYY